jgi:hypothetical protein
MAAAKQRRQYAYDVELLMKDAGLVAADAADVVVAVSGTADIRIAEPRTAPQTF